MNASRQDCKNNPFHLESQSHSSELVLETNPEQASEKQPEQNRAALRFSGRQLKSCYVHIPFCSSICSYCAFERTVDLSKIEAWLAALLAELEEAIAQARVNDPDFCLETLYFGGGTPSLLSKQQLSSIAAVLKPVLAEDAEWTMEVNPDHMDLQKLKFLKSLGINRLSIGIQSFSDASLQKMNRKHTADQARAIIAMARQAGFTNLSADLIYALPWSKMEELEQDLQSFLWLDLPHLSIYSLQIEENSVFGKKKLEPVDEDLEADEYEKICQVLKQAGYEHYEISSFAKKGYASRHNLAYWSDKPYLGIGFGAAGYSGQDFYHHKGTLAEYIQQGCQLERDEDLDPAFCALMMGLRTRYGFNLEEWSSRYHKSLAGLQEILKKYEGFLELRNGNLAVNERGMEILNSILVDFLEEF